MRTSSIVFRITLLTVVIIGLPACQSIAPAIYVNCDLVTARGFSETETDNSDAAKIPWVRNVKSFTGKFPIGWGQHDGAFAGTKLQVAEVSDTSLKGTMHYESHLIDQPDGTILYQEKGNELDYTFEFNRLNNELTVVSSDKGQKVIKIQILHFTCRRVTP